MDIKTKLNIEDKCFFMQENKVVTDNVTNIKVFINRGGGLKNETNIIYVVGASHSEIREENIFPSKEELLKSL